MQEEPEVREQEREAIRSGYDYAQTLTSGVAEQFPEGGKIDVREEIFWVTEQVSDDPEERAKLLPHVAYGFREGVLDRLFKGESRYQL